MTGVAIEPVSGSRKDLKRFLDVTRTVFRGDPNWVQPLTLERLDHLDAKKNRFLDGIEIAYWIARKNGKPAGRISAQVNRRHLERYGDATGHFGFMDAIDDHEVWQVLTAAAEAWLRAKGLARVLGPFTLSINDESGMLVEGFDTPPSMMMGHGQAHYAPRLEACGYTKIKDLLCYRFDVQKPWPARARAVADRLAGTKGLHVRRLDEKRFVEEISTVCTIFNDAWSDNWGFIPFGEAEAQYLAKSIRPLVTGDHFAIAELHGRPVAMVVTLPNLNEAIADLDGRLLPFGWARLLWRLKVKGVKSGRMPLMGVAREFHGTRTGAALAMSVIDHVQVHHRAKGVTDAELSWILEDNKGMHDIIRSVGGVPYKTYRVYEKAL